MDLESKRNCAPIGLENLALRVRLSARPNEPRHYLVVGLRAVRRKKTAQMVKCCLCYLFLTVQRLSQDLL